jgi:hypothetical protein
LGTEAKEITLCEKRVKDGAIRVLEGHDKRGGVREEEGGSFDPRGELYDMKAVIGGIVTEKGLVACFLEMSWGNLSDSSGDSINEPLAPLDI